MQPLVFQPIFKRIRWGGRRFGTVLGKPIGPGSDFAESWEVSDHGDDQSIVADGPYVGWTLQKLVDAQNLPLLGRHAGRQQFPLLVKYLDANEALSVQVHPDDRLAREFDPTENGKTEAWVIIDAEPGSELFAGFREGIAESDVRKAIEEGGVEGLLNRVPARSGDCLFVPAGTIHSIGDGVLLAEIQQSSDITFRLHDWNRVGADGRLRELHIDNALRCIDFDRGPVSPVTPTPIDADHSCEELVRCLQFVMQQHRVDGRITLEADDTCHVLMVLGGEGKLEHADGTRPLPLGQTVLLPAERSTVTITSQSPLTILDAFVP